MRKRLMRLLSVRACWDSSWETDALFSAAMELSWTTAEISLIPFSTDTIISDCWTLAAAISSISYLMDWTQSPITFIAETA